jgi:hypothetical protein
LRADDPSMQDRNYAILLEDLAKVAAAVTT